MEVSTLRDRRLVALFATVVIVGSGAAAAVVGLEVQPPYQGPSATEAALGFLEPAAPQPHGAGPAGPATLPDSQPVVVVVAEDPPADPSSNSATPPRSAPSPAPVDPCSGTTTGGPQGPDCSKPATPTPAPKVQVADVPPAPLAPRVSRGVVAASDPEPPKPAVLTPWVEAIDAVPAPPASPTLRTATESSTPQTPEIPPTPLTPPESSTPCAPRGGEAASDPEPPVVPALQDDDEITPRPEDERKSRVAPNPGPSAEVHGNGNGWR